MPDIDMRTVTNSLKVINPDDASVGGMYIVTCNFPLPWVLYMNKLVEEKFIAPSRSELLRMMAKEFFDNHCPGWWEEARKAMAERKRDE